MAPIDADGSPNIETLASNANSSGEALAFNAAARAADTAEAARAAAEAAIQAALAAVNRNGATLAPPTLAAVAPPAPPDEPSAAALDWLAGGPGDADAKSVAAWVDWAVSAVVREANTAQFAELLKTVRANRDDDLEIAAVMECVLKWRCVVALTPAERAAAMSALPSEAGGNPGAIEEFVSRNTHLNFDDIRSMPLPLRRHLLAARIKELASDADTRRMAETDEKLVEAAAAAVEKCRQQTRGAACYICLDDEAAEGLVRGCACRGESGYAHVSCLARQAHIHFGDNLAKGMQSADNDVVFVRWNECRLCDQSYYGPVGTAIAWACLASYASRARNDGVLLSAMGLLARFLDLDKRHAEALKIREDAWEIVRHWEDESSRIVVRGDLAQSYEECDRFADALEIWRDLYERQKKLRGPKHERTLMNHTKVAWTLMHVNGHAEAAGIMRATLRIAGPQMRPENGVFLSLRSTLAYGLYQNEAASLLDLRESVATFDALCVVSRRVFGADHPVVAKREKCLGEAREKLAAARALPRCAVEASYAF